MKKNFPRKIAATFLLAGILMTSSPMAMPTYAEDARVATKVDEQVLMPDDPPLLPRTTEPIKISFSSEMLSLEKYTLPKNTTTISPYYINNNSSKKIVTFTGNYEIHQKKNGSWVSLYSVKDSTTTTTLNAGSPQQEVITLPAALEPGEYRFVKPIGGKEYTTLFTVSDKDTATKVQATLNRTSFPEGTRTLLYTITNNTAKDSSYDFQYKLMEKVPKGWLDITGDVAFNDIAAFLPIGKEENLQVTLRQPLKIGQYQLQINVGTGPVNMPFSIVPADDYSFLLNIYAEKDSYPAQTDSINIVVDNATESTFNFNQNYIIQQKINNKWVGDKTIKSATPNKSKANAVYAWKTRTFPLSLGRKLPVGEYRIVMTVEGQTISMPFTIK